MQVRGCADNLKPPDRSRVSYLDALGLHMLSQAQLIQLLGVGYAIVPYNWVSQGQDLTSVAGVSQGLGVPKAGGTAGKNKPSWRGEEMRHIFTLLTEHKRLTSSKKDIWGVTGYVYSLCSPSSDLHYCITSNVFRFMSAGLVLTPPGQC